MLKININILGFQFTVAKSNRVDCYFTLVLTPRTASEKYIYSFNNSFLEAEPKTGVTLAPQWSDTIIKTVFTKIQKNTKNTIKYNEANKKERKQRYIA